MHLWPISFLVSSFLLSKQMFFISNTHRKLIKTLKNRNMCPFFNVCSSTCYMHLNPVMNHCQFDGLFTYTSPVSALLTLTINNK